MSRVTTVLVLLSGAVATATAGATPDARFELQAFAAERPEAASDDGRFAMAASARIEAPADTASRWRLTSSLVGCDPTPPDLLFGDGYEN